MEIGITKKEILTHAFDKDKINGLYEIDSCLITSYNLVSPHFNYPLKLYLLKERIKNRKLYKCLIDELDITPEFLKKRVLYLSSGELIKILVVKACLSSSLSVLLNHIDAQLSYGDLRMILTCLKRNIKEVDKTIVFSSTNLDNIVPLCTKYVVLNNADVDYAGNNIEMLPKKTELMEFVDLANEHKAKMSYYKEPSDLLKAIYRSVKK